MDSLITGLISTICNSMMFENSSALTLNYFPSFVEAEA